MQADLVVYARQVELASTPRVGLIIAKSVGSAVQRHRVARQLRHIARTVLPELDPSEHVVVRALPSSQGTISGRLEQQLRVGLQQIGRPPGSAG